MRGTKVIKNKKTKKAGPEAKRDASATLTVADQFFIKNNGQLSVEELAQQLDKPLDIVVDFCKDFMKREKNSKALKLMDKPAKGVVAMTQAASMVGDEARSQYVTEESINQAIVRGDHKTAKALKRRYLEQQKAERVQIKSKYRDVIHHIIVPGEDEDVF
jgi:hypothetical protein